MCGLGLKRKQQRPNESFVEIFHRAKGLLVLMLMLVIARKIAARQMPVRLGPVASYRRSFPDTKLAEHRVENLFHINSANNFSDCVQCFIKMYRSVFLRQSIGLCCRGLIA